MFSMDVRVRLVIPDEGLSRGETIPDARLLVGDVTPVWTLPVGDVTPAASSSASAKTNKMAHLV